MEMNIMLDNNGIGVFTAPIHKLTPEDLPPEGKYVLIYVPSRPWFDNTDFRNVYWKTAKLKKGITKKERAEMFESGDPEKVKRAQRFYTEDEDGNNKHGYYFDGFGLDSYNADEVEYWMELPNIPKEMCETYREYEERTRTYTHIVFSNDGGKTISGTSGINDDDTHFGYIIDNKKELDESLVPTDFKWVKFKKESLLGKYNELAVFSFLGAESEKYLDYFCNQFNNKTEE